ncbi:MAG: hypothetical protein KC502_03475 [Myxococcales bacterium]|nr:hypothetical protein [Myxococcales bacterium]
MPRFSPRLPAAIGRPLVRWLPVLALLLLMSAPAAAETVHAGLAVQVGLHELDERRRAPLQRIVRRALKDVEHTLAAKLDGNLRVDFAGSDAAFRRLVKQAGAGGNFGEPWVAGLALLHRDQVLVRLNGPGLLYTSEVVRHELAHVAIHALAGDKHLPRWFHEGVAMIVAGEATLARMQQGLSSGGFGATDDLSKLNAAFSGHRLRVQRAYAVSAGFLKFAVQRSGRRTALAELHRRMALGLDFGPAFTATFGLPPADLFALYARFLDSSDSRWTLFLSDSAIWSLIGLLSLIAMTVAWLRRPQFDGEPMDLEAIAQIGEAALRSGVLWLPEPKPEPDEFGLQTIAVAGSLSPNLQPAAPPSAEPSEDDQALVDVQRSPVVVSDEVH